MRGVHPFLAPTYRSLCGTAIVRQETMALVAQLREELDLLRSECDQCNRARVALQQIVAHHEEVCTRVGAFRPRWVGPWMRRALSRARAARALSISVARTTMHCAGYKRSMRGSWSNAMPSTKRFLHRRMACDCSWRPHDR